MGPAAERFGSRIWFAQGLRGVAALIVVLEHLTQDFINAPSLVRAYAFAEPVNALPEPPLHGVVHWLAARNFSSGIFAVGLFFLVSGFVIPFSLERRTLGGFAIRRFFRLYPTLWACMGLTVLFVVLLSGHEGFPYSASTIAANVPLLSRYVNRDHIDPVYWTLAIEEVFYVCAALIAWRGLLNRRATVIVLAGVLAIISVWIGNPPFPSVASPRPVPYFWARNQLGFNATFVIFILVGVVFHQHYRRTWRTPECLAIGLGLLATYWVCLHNGPFMGNQAAVYFTCSVLALAVFLPLYALRDRIPYSKALDDLGEISYPLYLIHTIVGWVMLHALTRATGQFYVALAVTVPAVFLLAVGVHRLVERPSMEMGRRLAARPRFRRDEPERDPVPAAP